MRWDNLRAGSPGPPALFAQGAVARTFDTPAFRGLTFYEVQARSILNRVPEASRVPFRWTINTFRGCSHACVYCFARNTHTYLDLDAGRDFETQIVVKVNAVELLRRELAAPRWRGEHVAMGTNTDPYQRAEGRYALMPGIIRAFTEAANPFSVLTKGTLIERDIPLLAEAADVTDVHANVSVGFVGDDGLWRLLEPGTPAPERRLAACRALNEAGVPCGVLMAPIVPFLTDTADSLERTIGAIAGAGAVAVSPIALHLRPGARAWFFRWLDEHHPQLVTRYRALYGRGSYLPDGYQRDLAARVSTIAARRGIGSRPAVRSRGARLQAPAPTAPVGATLPLFPAAQASR